MYDFNFKMFLFYSIIYGNTLKYVIMTLSNITLHRRKVLIQIEFFDDENLINLISVLSVKPDKVCFVYDNKNFSKKDIDKIFNTCKVHIKDLQCELHPVNSKNLNEIYDLTLKLIPEDEECVIDLTGGSDLMIIAGYKVATQNDLVKMIYIDIEKEEVINLENGQVISKTSSVSLEDYLSSIGAWFLPNTIEAPKSEDFDRISKMAKYIFNNISEWRMTSNYLQQSMSFNPCLEFKNTYSYRTCKSKYRPNKALLIESERLGFISDLKINNMVEFSFPSQTYKYYMTTYGIWLELFVYIEAHKLMNVSEIIHGAIIDWVVDDGIDKAGNEIDVLLNMKSRPISISCKLTDPDIESINEILVNTRRISGRKGKGILVAFSDMKKNNSSTFIRAKNLGIGVIDKQDILSDNFSERLERIIYR